ncbi:DUF2147 domain-containing protein [Collimonas pratensis]|uniref:DUF2147 domain-containing protein n=1 Tax=Collimonas pratensis TaxID=279113 RepID=A0A127QCJ1_9BURK|nr:DUF2147 domain-containing protein [Collimonas pratensis]AMP07565.1 hypothetical protein CPter91_5279 [Collimonas pratensis]
MTNLSQRLLSKLAASCILISTFAQAQQPAQQGTAAESGRWITESGNLEVDIAPCGTDMCGTIVRVIANRSMSNPTVAMQPTNAGSPLGKKILFDLKPAEQGGWQGHIYNRENDKTYNSLIALIAPDQLKLTVYEDTPAHGKTQVWKRPDAQVPQ